MAKIRRWGMGNNNMTGTNTHNKIVKKLIKLPKARPVIHTVTDHYISGILLCSLDLIQQAIPTKN